MLSYDKNRIGAAATEIIRTTKPKIFAVWPFVENVCGLQSEVISLISVPEQFCVLSVSYAVTWWVGIRNFVFWLVMSYVQVLWTQRVIPSKVFRWFFPRPQSISSLTCPDQHLPEVSVWIPCKSPIFSLHNSLLSGTVPSPWPVFLFLESHQSGKTTGSHLRSTFPMPWPGTLKPKIWDWELISFVSQISGITAPHFLTSASWNCCFVYFACGFVYCFVFSLFGARSQSAPCQPLLSRSRSLTLFWTPFSQWNYLSHEVLVLLNHFNCMVFHPLSCLKQSEEAENSAALHVAHLFICSDLLFGIHGSWKECLDS